MIFVDPRNPQVLLTWQDNGNVNDNYKNEFVVTLWADYGQQRRWQQVAKEKYIGRRSSIVLRHAHRPNSCYEWQVAAIDLSNQANPWFAWSQRWYFCTGKY